MTKDEIRAIAEKAEPEGYIVQEESQDGVDYTYSASYPEAVHEHINETIQRCVDNDIPAPVMHCRPFFLHPAIEPAGASAEIDLPHDLHEEAKWLVVQFAEAMAQKLAHAQRKYGYSDGWRSPDWMDECRQKLVEHLAKGDPRDVANYCAFLWYHKQPTAPVGAAPLPDAQLCRFYNVNNFPDLVAAMEHHIEKLQAKLPPTPSLWTGRVREG